MRSHFPYQPRFTSVVWATEILHETTTTTRQTGGAEVWCTELGWVVVPISFHPLSAVPRGRELIPFSLVRCECARNRLCVCVCCRSSLRLNVVLCARRHFVVWGGNPPPPTHNHNIPHCPLQTVQTHPAGTGASRFVACQTGARNMGGGDGGATESPLLRSGIGWCVGWHGLSRWAQGRSSIKPIPPVLLQREKCD